MNIRLEQPKDYREVENLTREAFWNVYHPGCTEHYVLNQYRTNQDFIPELDFVMEEGDGEHQSTEGRHFYQFTVSDNGPGVESVHLDHIFERFYRIDKGRSRKLGGTGLGLAIVKNAVAAHGGTATAQLTPGGGLTIRFTLARF